MPDMYTVSCVWSGNAIRPAVEKPKIIATLVFPFEAQVFLKFNKRTLLTQHFPQFSSNSELLSIAQDCFELSHHSSHFPVFYCLVVLEI